MGRLRSIAKELHPQIQHFLETHTITNPLPRGTKTEVPVDIQPSNLGFNEEEEDELVSYLCLNFTKLQDFSVDLPSLIKDLIHFIQMEAVKDNEMDGFSLFNMTEQDIFLMLPGKVGPARKILTLVTQEKEKWKQTEETCKGEQNVIEALEGTAFKEEDGLSTPGTVASGSTPRAASPVSDALKEETSTCSQEHKPLPGPSCDLASFIPTYSPLISDLLKTGEINKEWDKFIEETAYYLAGKGNFETRGIYADFGRLMYQKFPCIGHKAFSDPWKYFNKKLSQKLRNIRWKWNARSKGIVPSTTKKRKLEPVLNNSVPKEQMTMAEADKIFKEQLSKPDKNIDRALMIKTQRISFKERRNYVERKHDGDLKELLRKLPILGKADYVEREFFLMKPGLSKAIISDNWTEMLTRLDKVLNTDNGDEDEAGPGNKELLEVIQKLECKIQFFHKGKSAKNPLISIVKTSELKKVATKRDDPPRLVFVEADNGTLINAFVVGGGIEMEVNMNIKDALAHLVYSYYVWDLTYPKNYQLLGFLQVYLLGDEKNKFVMSQNYLKFTKLFGETDKE
ncbi:hypothetical protein FSP39_005919 [Pinctada imbricata]|uniref:Uncharacterized protein n=1 Tax=Pinctada imbricata TaxID=66713 RepID=A0AA89C2N3_PINIB|nr:hypothetical protein FSP39_005919 [Pinctada imbricata]